MPSVKDNPLGVFDTLQSSHIAVNQNRCAVVRNRHAQCLKCAEVCTSGCISVIAGELHIDASLCIGCGTCATVCPTCALEAIHPSDSQLFLACESAMRKCNNTALIGCRTLFAKFGELMEETYAVPLACLGRVDESLVLMLASIGAKEIILLAGECDNCPHKSGRQTAGLVCDGANNLLKTWESKAHARIVDGYEACAEVYSSYAQNEHGEFSSETSETSPALNVQASQQATQNLEPKSSFEPLPIVKRYIFERPEKIPAETPAHFVRVMADKTLPHYLPSRRKRTLSALSSLGTPDGSENITTRLWGHVVIDFAKCGSCRMCATFCPTGAIQKFANPDGTFGIKHYPASCVKCRTCENICSTGALTIVDEVSVQDIVDDSYECYSMKPLKFEPGNLGIMHERVSDLIGVEECYDH